MTSGILPLPASSSPNDCRDDSTEMRGVDQFPFQLDCTLLPPVWIDLQRLQDLLCQGRRDVRIDSR